MPRRICTLLPVVAILLFGLVQPALALGVSPPEVFAEHVLRGVAQTQGLYVSRGLGEQGVLHMEVSAEGEYASHLIFEPSFDFPAGQTNVWYPFKIDPLTLATGTYEVLLTFLSRPEVKSGSGGGASASVLTSATARINFTISGEQVLSYVLDNVSVHDTESDDHVFVSITITNTGNVDWKPDRVDLTIVDANDPGRIVEASIVADALTLVGAGGASTQTVELNQSLAEGSYVATAVFYYEEQKVGELVSDQFIVYAPGTLLQSGELTEVVANNTEFKQGEKILLSAVFKNTGELPIDAVFYTEVARDGAYEDLVRSDELSVDVESIVDFSQVIEAKKPGVYELKSYVKYANKKTSPISVTVTVKGGVLSVLNSPIAVGAISLATILGFVFVALKRRGTTIGVVLKKATEGVGLLVKKIASSTPRPKVKPQANSKKIITKDSLEEAPLPSDDSDRGW